MEEAVGFDAKPSEKAFAIRHYKSGERDIPLMQGFWMTFANGYTVSVQFGSGNYSDGGKTTAEIAAWDKNDKWYVPKEWGNHDTVKGHAGPEEVAAFIAEVSQL